MEGDSLRELQDEIEDELSGIEASDEEGQSNDSQNVDRKEDNQESSVDESNDASGEEGRDEESQQDETNDASGEEGQDERQEMATVPIARLTKVSRIKRKLERNLTGAEKRIAELEAELESRGSFSDGSGEHNSDPLSKERIESIRDDYGDEFADIIEALTAKVTTSDNNQRGEDTGNDHYEADNKQGNGNPETWGEFVDALPEEHPANKIDYWRQFEPEKYKVAVELERNIGSSDEYKGMPLPDFYEKLVGEVEKRLIDTGKLGQASGQVDSDYDSLSNISGGGSHTGSPIDNLNTLDGEQFLSKIEKDDSRFFDDVFADL